LVEGKDPVLKNEYIICSAHYDHIGIGRPDNTGDSIYNGARDNAIGVMSVMMAADNVSKHPVDRSVIFVLFTGEEKGLLGSKWFVNHPPISLKEIIFCLNTDGGGYNDTTIATIMGKKRLNTMDIFKKACLKNGLSAFEGTDDTQFLFSSSDNIMFSREGIPSVTISPGFRDLDVEIMKYFHQPSDEVETLNFNYVEKYSKSFGLSLRMISDSKDRIFWKEGDEFYAIGKALYK
jgi:Zn-dependent M28 family amino/carboxypeptidase